eukprot:407539_1
MTFINNSIYTMLILLLLLICNVNSMNDNTLQQCTFNISLAEIGNPITQYCSSRSKHNNKPYDSLDQPKNADKRRQKFIKTCISYTITTQMIHLSKHMSLFLPLCPQSGRYELTNIKVSDVSHVITNDTFKNGSNVKQAVGYLYGDTLGILVQLIDKTVSGFELCVRNIKHKKDKSVHIEKIGTSKGIVWINSTNEIPDCTVHGLPCFNFNFTKTCDRSSINSYISTYQPVIHPTISPTNTRSNYPTHITYKPTINPTSLPSNTPTNIPTITPTNPTAQPIAQPTHNPTNIPTITP